MTGNSSGNINGRGSKKNNANANKVKKQEDLNKEFHVLLLTIVLILSSSRIRFLKIGTRSTDALTTVYNVFTNRVLVAHNDYQKKEIILIHHLTHSTETAHGSHGYVMQRVC